MLSSGSSASIPSTSREAEILPRSSAARPGTPDCGAEEKARSLRSGSQRLKGARRGDVLRLVLGQGMLLTTAGLTVGIAAALALTRYLNSVLFGITASDVLTYGEVALLLCVVSMAACYVPARRATKVDPMVALRDE